MEYIWNLKQIENEIISIKKYLKSETDDEIRIILYEWLCEYHNMVCERQRTILNVDDQQLTKKIKYSTLIYKIIIMLYQISSIKNSFQQVDDIELFQYRNMIIPLLIEIIREQYYDCFGEDKLQLSSYDEIIATVDDFLNSVDDNYAILFRQNLPNFEIRTMNARKVGQVISVGKSYMYVVNDSKRILLPIGATIAHESGHLIQMYNNDNNISNPYREALAIIFELLYIDYVHENHELDSIYMRRIVLDDYLSFIEILLTQMCLRDNIKGILFYDQIFYKKPFINKRIMERYQLKYVSQHSYYSFSEVVSYSLGFLIAVKILNIYRNDRERGKNIINKIIDLSGMESVSDIDQILESELFGTETLDSVKTYIKEYNNSAINS